MANQTPVSSLIGANLSATDTTALFALGTVCNTDDGGRFEYVEATATQTTGKFVLLTPSGTAITLTTARLTGNTAGYDIAAVQGLVSQGEFAWVAKQGRNMFVLVTGTMTAGNPNQVGFAAAGSRLQALTALGVGATAFGIFLTSSTPTGAGPHVTLATLTWPSAAIKQ